jgi:DsbC/DsbD-like thiol-disulfide interchange protein
VVTIFSDYPGVNQLMMNLTIKKYKTQRYLLLALLMAFSLQASAQIMEPVKWSYGAKMTGKNEAVIFLKATIDDGWHIYSTRQKDGGPVKTTFTFTPAADYILNGKINEPVPITKYEKTFGINVLYFEHAVVFQQKVHLKKAQAIVNGTVEFMVCNDQKCLPPDDITFSIPIK